jgi:hypothetical protein
LALPSDALPDRKSASLGLTNRQSASQTLTTARVNVWAATSRRDRVLADWQTSRGRFATGRLSEGTALKHAQTIGAIAHRLCRLIWKILHERIRYEERGPAVSHEAKKVRARKMIRELRSLGYRRRTAPGSIEQSRMIERDFRPWMVSSIRDAVLFVW